MRIEDVKWVNLIYVRKFKDSTMEDEKRFKTIGELVKFFHEWKRHGEVVGYVIVKNRPKAFNDDRVEGKLAVQWEDKFGMCKKGFDNVYQLSEFLTEVPLIAEKVGFIPKKMIPSK